MRLVDIDERISVLENKFDLILPEIEEKAMIQFLSEAETVDAKPVIHGRWIKEEYIDATCSVCGESWNLYDNWTDTFKYCPYCGVKMDLEVEN